MDVNAGIIVLMANYKTLPTLTHSHIQRPGKNFIGILVLTFRIAYTHLQLTYILLSTSRKMLYANILVLQKTANRISFQCVVISKIRLTGKYREAS